MNFRALLQDSTAPQKQLCITPMYEVAVHLALFSVCVVDKSVGGGACRTLTNTWSICCITCILWLWRRTRRRCTCRPTLSSAIPPCSSPRPSFRSLGAPTLRAARGLHLHLSQSITCICVDELHLRLTASIACNLHRQLKPPECNRLARRAATRWGGRRAQAARV